MSVSSSSDPKNDGRKATISSSLREDDPSKKDSGTSRRGDSFWVLVTVLLAVEIESFVGAEACLPAFTRLKFAFSAPEEVDEDLEENDGEVVITTLDPGTNCPSFLVFFQNERSKSPNQTINNADWALSHIWAKHYFTLSTLGSWVTTLDNIATNVGKLMIMMAEPP
jgi:hypothetical protein